MCAFSAPRRCAPLSGSSGVADGALPRTVGLLGGGCHRGGMGGAVRPARRRRAAVRPRRTGRGARPRGDRERPPRLRRADDGAASGRGRPDRHGEPGGGGSRRRVRPGERSGARGAEARPDRRRGLGHAGRRRDRVVDIGPPPVPAPGGRPAPGAGRRRPPLPPGLPAAARRGLRGLGDVARRGRVAPRASTGRWACRPSACGRRSTGSSPTGCSRPCGARRCGWSQTAWRRSARSTMRSASAQASGGRSWARSSPTAWPAATRACAASSSTSARRSSGRGRSSPTCRS